MSGIALKHDPLGFLYKERRDFHIKPQTVFELWPDASPFLTVMSSKTPQNVDDPDYKLFEHRPTWLDQRMVVGGSPAVWGNGEGGHAGAPGGTVANVVVASSVNLGAQGAVTVNSALRGLQVEVRASNGVLKGQAIVHDTTSTTQITLQSLGNPAADTNRATNLAAGDILYVIGNAFGEGTHAPETFADELTTVYNSAQIFKASVEVTGTLHKTALRGYSDELARRRREKLRELKMQMERAFLFGTRAYGIGYNTANFADSLDKHLTDKDSNTLRTTMGIISAIRRYGAASGDNQNLFNIDPTSYKYADFVDQMEKVFRNIPSSGMKTALCGGGALSFWSKAANDTGFFKNSGWSVSLQNWERDSLGFRFQRLTTPHGEIKLVNAPILRGFYNNTMVVIDEDNVGIKQFRPFTFETNIKKENMYDGIKDGWMYDAGLHINLIETHALFTIG